MTDKEAILSIINCNFNFGAHYYKNRHNLKCINLCNSCKYQKIKSEFPCWQHKIADMLLEAIPQFDIAKTLNKKESVENLKFVCRVFERALNNALGIDHAYTDAYEKAEKEILKEQENT